MIKDKSAGEERKEREKRFNRNVTKLDITIL